ncbi:remorin 4.1-like [Rutidosis leptorrhynchoides]|uniref:remorin 4.1-like n=1 Tax=Rutidosis leptorrhynchoides TaxID=125765 RepID=UPI003A99E6F0
MFNDQIPSSSHQNQNQNQNDEDEDDENIREIHALTPPLPLPPSYRRRENWDTTSHRSSSLSVVSTESENFTTMSREFNALVLAGTGINGSETSEVANSMNTNNGSSNLERIGEDDIVDNNPLAIVADNNPIMSPSRRSGQNLVNAGGNVNVASVVTVKKEEVESKILAWQNAKIAKINNRFKRDDAIINGWENEQVQKSTSWMKKIERKLEAKRARAMEKMQNDIAKAKRKSEEKRATAEAKRGTKVARVLEVANLMRAVGRAPTKRSFF